MYGSSPPPRAIFVTIKVPPRYPNRWIVFRATPNWPNRPLKHRENHLRYFWRIWKHSVVGCPCLFLCDPAKKRVLPSRVPGYLRATIELDAGSSWVYFKEFSDSISFDQSLIQIGVIKTIKQPPFISSWAQNPSRGTAVRSLCKPNLATDEPFCNARIT